MVKIIDKNGICLEKEIVENREFPVFSSSVPLNITSTQDALSFSTNLGSFLLDQLSNLDKPSLFKILEYISSKAVRHPALVLKEMKEFVKTDEFCRPLEKLGFDKKQSQSDMEIIAVLHDIGRFSEIDLLTGSVITRNHAFESFRILQSIGEHRPEILLPVKLHGVLNFEKSLNEDSIFNNLPLQKQEQIKLYGYAIRDIDRLANIDVKSKKGLKDCLELSNPRYKADYRLTPESVNHILKGESCVVGEEHSLGDAILRFIGWSNLIRYPYVKARSIPMIDGLWNCLYKEIDDEYNNSTDKDLKVYTETIKTIDYLRKHSMENLKQSYLNKEFTKQK